MTGEQPGPQPPGHGRHISRRAFLGTVVGVVGTTYLVSLTGVSPLGFNLFDTPSAFADTITPPSATPDFTIAAERDVDLVLLDFEFYGFKLEQVDSVPTLVPTVTSTSNTGAFTSNIIIVRLPPQAIAEAEYNVKPGKHSYPPLPLPVDPPPIVSAVSGPSRLCFTLPPNVNVPLPTMTIADLLDWSQWTLVVPATAQINPPDTSLTSVGHLAWPVPYKPGPYETAIEFPYALFLAPVVWVSSDLPVDELSTAFDTYFTTRTAPLYNGQVADLWTATLGRTRALDQLIFETPTPLPQVVAVWADDYAAPGTKQTEDATEAGFVTYGPPPPPPPK
jgi:hypothetical protein